MFRGSRKHVLDWTSRPEFCEELLRLVSPVEARLTPSSIWTPKGYDAPKEAELKTFGPEAMPESEVWPLLRRWWLVHERGANTPNWDIAFSCDIEETPGLILVEAKANVPELVRSGKGLRADASDNSRANHERIGGAIDEACAALRLVAGATAIRRDSHFQLSNRVAFAWKLASLGVPTILVYLGFLGDRGIADAGEPFRDEAHWNDSFAAYAHSQVPRELFERRLDCGAAPSWFLARSRPVLSVSEPKVSRAELKAARFGHSAK